MVSTPDIDQALHDWETTLVQTESAANKDNWSDVRKLLNRANGTYTTIQLVLGADGGAPAAPLTEKQSTRLRSCQKMLAALTEQLQDRQNRIQNRIRKNQRAKAMADAYKQGPLNKPSKVRLSTGSPHNTTTTQRRRT